jgi:hypothetical protein
MAYPEGRAAIAGRFIDETGTPVSLLDHNDLRQSRLGRYFFGRTETMTPSSGNPAWARLRNLENSDVVVMVNVWTITNRSGQSFDAQIWLGDPDLPGTPSASTSITSPNRTDPVAEPQALMDQVTSTSGSISGGLNPFMRRVESNRTMVVQEHGKIILPPGKGFVIYLTEVTGSVTSNVAFGWWEEPVL